MECVLCYVVDILYYIWHIVNVIHLIFLSKVEMRSAHSKLNTIQIEDDENIFNKTQKHMHDLTEYIIKSKKKYEDDSNFTNMNSRNIKLC